MSNRGYSRFRNLNISGCFLSKKRLTKGGGGQGHPRTPPPPRLSYALELEQYYMYVPFHQGSLYFVLV